MRAVEVDSDALSNRLRCVAGPIGQPAASAARVTTKKPGYLLLVDIDANRNMSQIFPPRVFRYAIDISHYTNRFRIVRNLQ